MWPDYNHTQCLTFSTRFFQASSRCAISSIQWVRVCIIPIVVALNVRASPLKSTAWPPCCCKIDAENEGHILLYYMYCHHYRNLELYCGTKFDRVNFNGLPWFYTLVGMWIWSLHIKNHMDCINCWGYIFLKKMELILWTKSYHW